MIDIDTLEALAGPLPGGRAYESPCLDCPSTACGEFGDYGLTPAQKAQQGCSAWQQHVKAEAALAEAYAVIKRLAKRTEEAEAELSRLREHLKSADTGGWFYAYDEQLQRRIAAEDEARKLRQLLAICDACHEPIKAVPRRRTSVAQTARDANLAAVEKCWHEAETEARTLREALAYAVAEWERGAIPPEDVDDLLAQYEAEHGGGA